MQTVKSCAGRRPGCITYEGGHSLVDVMGGSGICSKTHEVTCHGRNISWAPNASNSIWGHLVGGTDPEWMWFCDIWGGHPSQGHHEDMAHLGMS